MHVGSARIEGHADVREIVPSAHCVQRYRRRMPVREAGIAPVAQRLLDVLEAADITGWPPGWAVSDRSAALWAVAPGDAIAFPLAPAEAGPAGRWIALTCLRRGER
ncbi:MAG: hypothetical protein JWM31_1664 [Solirubrobacterales bacterium]|nr:hypothetical protein [Solirubrobacterales bacterium]